MSAILFLLDAYRQRSSSVRQTALVAGIPALVAVLVGGISLGLMICYAVVTRLRPHDFETAIFAMVGMLIGVAVSFLGWQFYALYLSYRSGVDRLRALKTDSWAWPTLALFPFLIVQPWWLISSGRALGITIAAFLLAKLIGGARLTQTVRDVLIIFVVTRISIVVIAELASAMIGQRAGAHVTESDNPLMAVWGRWDAVHYLDIARRGYYGTDMAFFPLFPLFINLLARLAGSPLAAGLIISNAAAFFALLFFYKLVEHQYNRAIAHRAIFYVSIFPTAVFFSAVYTESLFFALTVASFYYIREHRWLVAGILGGLAAATRVEGMLLIVPYAMELASTAAPFNRRVAGTSNPVDIVAHAISGLLIPLGLFAYMVMLWVLHGDPLYFSHVQAHWNRHLALPWVSVLHSFTMIAHAHSAVTVANQVLELVFTLLMVVVFFAGIKRLRPSFSAYMALSILVPMSTSSLMSMPRFALVLFPMFVTLALWGNRPWVNNAIVAFSLPLLGLFTVLFADWYWVA